MSRHLAVLAAVLCAGTYHAAAQNIRLCAQDGDCQQFGDVNATCSSGGSGMPAVGTCDCSSIWEGDLCEVSLMANGTNSSSTNTSVSIYTTMTATCSQDGNTLLEADINERYVNNSDIPTATVRALCGSITVLATMSSVQVSDFANVVNAAANDAADGIISRTSYTGITQRSQLTFNTRVGAADAAAGGQCANDITVSAIFLNGRCIATECVAASNVELHTYTENGRQVSVCRRIVTAPVNDSDDELSGGAIAAIVLGCVLLGAAAVMLLYFACLSPSTRTQIPDEHEPECEPGANTPDGEAA